ncbi:MAG: pirin family protein [Planctomycetota bacterium]|nr:pirin family protein [Planctomycetota bacterium]
MITVIPSESRYYANHGWLEARWHFSFGDYFDRRNMNWSALRVFNDDIIHGGGGFDLHPHRDMEIITVVLDGALRHQDNLGNNGIIRPGEVQVMSAGTGIIHAEHNDSPTQPLHLMQIWLTPAHRGNAPRWEQKQFEQKNRAAALMPVVSNGDIPGTLKIDQDATIFLSTLTAGQQVTRQVGADRSAYLFVINGNVELNGKSLAEGDQGRIAEERELRISVRKDAEFILLDLP